MPQVQPSQTESKNESSVDSRRSRMADHQWQQCQWQWQSQTRRTTRTPANTATVTASTVTTTQQQPPRIQQRPEGTDLPASQTHRIALAVLACLQNSLVGGLVYGWASLNSTLLTTEPFPRGGCGLTLADTTVIFAMASCTGMASTLLLGFCLDRFGPRVCSVTSHVAIAAGCQLFAASTAFTGFALATCLIAFGGPGIQVSIVHLANLFPKNQFTALAMLNGTISISMSVFAAL